MNKGDMYFRDAEGKTFVAFMQTRPYAWVLTHTNDRKTAIWSRKLSPVSDIGYSAEDARREIVEKFGLVPQVWKLVDA